MTKDTTEIQASVKQNDLEDSTGKIDEKTPAETEQATTSEKTKQAPESTKTEDTATAEEAPEHESESETVVEQASQPTETVEPESEHEDGSETKSESEEDSEAKSKSEESPKSEDLPMWETVSNLKQDIDAEKAESVDDVSQNVRERDRSNEYIRTFEKNLRPLRRCLVEAFTSLEHVRTFCFERLQDVSYDLKDNDTQNEIVGKMIAYCDAHGNIDFLYNFLAEERPKKYTSCYENNEWFDSIDRIKQLEHKKIQNSTKSASPVKKTKPKKPIIHPLTQDEETIRRWFFENLNQREQCFVITVAIFEGASLGQIRYFSKEMEELICGEVKQDLHDQDAPSDQIKRKCQGTTKKGEPCSKTAMQGSKFCQHHQPKDDESSEKPKLAPDITPDLLQRLSLVVSDKKRTGDSQANIKTLNFVKPDQRGKILNLLDHSLSSHLPKIYEYLRKLGSQSNDHTAFDERRNNAALAVGELMCQLNFAELQNEIISSWTNQIVYQRQFLTQARLHVNAHTFREEEARDILAHWFGIDRLSLSVTLLSAAKTLGYVAVDPSSKRKALNLLQHWMRNDNLSLNITALLTYLEVGVNYPDEVLTMLREFLVEKSDVFSLIPSVVFGIVNNIYALRPELVIEYLHEWVMDSDPKKEAFLRYIASLIFLDIVHLDDIPSDDVHNTHANVVEIIFALWDGLRILGRSEIQKDTSKLVRRWGNEAITSQPNTSSFNVCRRLFTDLDQKYKQTQIKNRLRFYFNKWQQGDERLITLLS